VILVIETLTKAVITQALACKPRVSLKTSIFKPIKNERKKSSQFGVSKGSKRINKI
jgi:hypothetical protein